MGTNDISIKICNSPAEAPNYNNQPKGSINAATLDEAVIVMNGTTEGHATIDLVFHDDKGNKFIAMITARLLNMVVTAAMIKPD